MHLKGLLSIHFLPEALGEAWLSSHTNHGEVGGKPVLPGFPRLSSCSEQPTADSHHIRQSPTFPVEAHEATSLCRELNPGLSFPSHY